jgi:hypothetical protein
VAKQKIRRPAWPGTQPGHLTGDLQGRPGAVYCRVSLNPDATHQEQKSVNDQERDGRAWTEQTGVQLRQVYVDDDRGASEYSGKERRAFDELRADVREGRYSGGVIWFYATSRQTRGDVSLDELKRECIEAGVLWCFHGQLVNPANHRDMAYRQFSGIMDSQYAADLSDAVTRGKGSSADGSDGFVKPPGRVAYGYRRQWDPGWTGKGRRWLRDVPDNSTTDEHGTRRPKENSPAFIVQEIFRRCAAGESLVSIRNDLRRRRIPMPGKPRRGDSPAWNWSVQTVKYIALNPLYIGKRVYQVDRHNPNRVDRMSAILPDVEYDETRMPHLIDRATFWRAYRTLTGDRLPEGHPLEGRRRRTTRNGPRSERWFLASVARCAECGSTMQAKRYPANSTFEWGYSCTGYTCTGIPMQLLDEYVLKVLAGVLGTLDIADEITGISDSRAAEKALGDLEQARAQIERMWRQVDAGEIDPVIATRTKRRLDDMIADADRRLRESTLPDSLTPEMIGQRAEAELRRMYAAGEWIKLRQIVRTVAEIRVHAVGRGTAPGGGAIPARFRVSFRPLMPVPGEWVPPLDYEPYRAEELRRTAERRPECYVSAAMHERIASVLRADPMGSDKRVMAAAGCNFAQAAKFVRRSLENAGEIPVIRRKGRGKPVNHGYLVHRLPVLSPATAAAAQAAPKGG